MKTKRTWVFVFCLCCWVIPACMADGIIVVVNDGRVERRGAGTGAYKGIVGNSGARAAATDGQIIVVLGKDGRVIRYKADTGAYTGMVGSQNATAVQVSGGVIVITYANGRSIRYDAKTGAYKGMI